jgi:tetratricopeptide (TPR) repeat protein
MLSEVSLHLDFPRHSRSSSRCRLTASVIMTAGAILILAASLQAFQLGGDTVRLEGTVSGEGGQPPPNARVRVESEEGDEVFETGLTDQGRYGFSSLTRNVYHVVATADGYDTYRETVDLTRSAFRTVLDITMTPLRTAATDTEPPSLTDAKAPRNARKDYQQGLKALAANRIPDAKAHFAKAVKEYPCYARAQTAEALSLISDRDLKGAESALRKAIDCDAGFISAYLKLGELYDAELRFDDSRQVLENGLRLDPGSWKFHYQLGAAYYGLGLYGKAEEEYRRSQSLTPPAPPDVHVKLADVYSKEKLYGRAYGEMQAYLAADPNGRFAAKVREVMREMRALAATHRASTAAAPAAADPKR